MSNKKKYDVKTENMDTYTFEHSLWKRLEGKELSESQINFLSQCLTENLEHARHAENERLTFNSIFLALVAGAMAFAGSLDPVMSAAIYLFLTIAGFLSIMLTARWNNTFSRHMFYARQCYRLLHINLFGAAEEPSEGWKSQEHIERLNEIPAYCFRINSPMAHTRFGNMLYRPRTRKLYTAFYLIVQLLLIICTVREFIKLF